MGQGGDGKSRGEGETGTHTGRAPPLRHARCWEVLHVTSELIFTTTLTFELKKAQRERTKLVQGHRASKQQNQDANPGRPGPKAIATLQLQVDKDNKKDVIALNLMCSWLQSYYLSFNLVRSVTPLQTIRNFIPKHQELCPSENLRDSGVGVKAGGVHAKVIRTQEVSAVSTSRVNFRRE